MNCPFCGNNCAEGSTNCPICGGYLLQNQANNVTPDYNMNYNYSANAQPSYTSYQPNNIQQPDMSYPQYNYTQSEQINETPKNRKKGLIITLLSILALGIIISIVLFAGGITRVGKYNFYTNSPSTSVNPTDYQLKVGLFGKSKFTIQGQTYDCKVDFNEDNVNIKINNDIIPAIYNKSDKSISLSSGYLSKYMKDIFAGTYKLENLYFEFMGESFTSTSTDMGISDDAIKLNIALDGTATFSSNDELLSSETINCTALFNENYVTLRFKDGEIKADFNPSNNEISISFFDIINYLDTDAISSSDIELYYDYFNEMSFILKLDESSDAGYDLTLKK